jgi:hypothetical protein
VLLVVKVLGLVVVGAGIVDRARELEAPDGRAEAYRPAGAPASA